MTVDELIAAGLELTEPELTVGGLRVFTRLPASPDEHGNPGAAWLSPVVSLRRHSGAQGVPWVELVHE